MQKNNPAFLNKNENKEESRYNILFLTKWYPNKFDPQLGVFVQKHAKAVAGTCNIILIYACPDEALASNYKIVVSSDHGFPEITVYYKKNNSILKFFINPYRYFNANRIGIKEAEKNIEVIDLIHVNILNRPGIVALILKKTKGIPYIITEHWTGYTSGVYEKSNFLKKWLTKKIISHASGVTTVSGNLKTKMLALGLNNNYFVVPNIIETIDLTEFQNHSKIKILTVADLLDSQKNISGIIKAIAEISKQNPAIEYHIIGDGPDKQMLMSLSDSFHLSDKIIFFHGRKTNEFVYGFFKQIDFVVINSNFETFSVVAAEALANGKPVITTICGGPEEFITSEYGILIEKGNQQQLENALSKMIATFKNYDALKLNSYITQKFNYTTIGKQFYEIYKRIIKR